MNPHHTTERAIALTEFRKTITTGKLQRRDGVALAELFRTPKAYPSKDACPLIRLGTFEGNSRATGSQLLTLDALQADYDAGQMTVAEAAGCLRAAGISALIYTSANHMVLDLPKYNGGPRWRVVAPLSAPIDEARHEALIDLLNGALGGVLAPESWQWPRCYYMGRVEGVAYELEQTDGQCIDVVALCPDFEPIAAPVKPKATRAIDRSTIITDDPVVEYMKEHWEVRGEAPGKFFVRCPKDDQHSTDTGPTSTVWLLATASEPSHFHCSHTSHGPIGDSEFLTAIGFDKHEDDFDVVALSGDQAAEAAAAAIRNAQKRAVSLEDFWAYLPDHKYIFTPTRAMWPAPSVDGAIKTWPKNPADPKKSIAPSKVLDRDRAVQQMTWLPGAPEIIENKVMLPSGWIDRVGARVFNRYLAPAALEGDAAQAGPWLDHLRAIYPDEWQHLVHWFAHRLQHPGEKINHALVLGGDQGIGKDSILVPIKEGVGASNCEDISPGALMGAFNGFAASVLLVVSEARDLGESDRFKLYEHSKTYICSPPDVLRVNEKHVREFYVPNLCGVVFTTNHRTSGLYLPADDRRHFVAWSEAKREQFAADYFPGLYAWYAGGGVGHVVAYLRALDLGGFDSKAPPAKTAAFWAMVQAGEAPESSELRDLVVALGTPEVMTVGQLIDEARCAGLHDFAADLADRKARTRLPHMLDRVGYVAVRSPDSADGRFGKYFVYGQRDMPASEQIGAARRLAAQLAQMTKTQKTTDGARATDFA